MSLRLCPGCQRHVRAHEVACPFCAGPLEVAGEPAALPSERLGRAAIMAFTTALAGTALVACSDGGGASTPSATPLKASASASASAAATATATASAAATATATSPASAAPSDSASAEPSASASASAGPQPTSSVAAPASATAKTPPPHFPTVSIPRPYGVPPRPKP